MGDWVFWVIAVLLVLFQVFTCIFAQKAWARWMPFFVSVVLAVFCMAMYLGSNQTNWGYLILVALLGIVLLLQGAILLTNRLIRWMTKR